MGKIAGACENCRKGFQKWGRLWVHVKTAERDSKSGEDCGCLGRLQKGIRKMGRIVGACEDYRKGLGKWRELWVHVSYIL